MKPVVFTCGHGTKTTQQLIQVLTDAGVQTVWDVRSKPYSRWNPQHNREALAEALKASGIGYVWMGNRLGGLDTNHGWDGAIRDLSRTTNTAVMCSESLPDKCHRHTAIEPDLRELGVTVRHLLYPPKEQAAPPVVELPKTLF